MPLLQLWASDPETISKLTIEQVVSNAGAGKMLDDSECQAELWAFLMQVSVDDLERYSNHCLESSFTNSGKVLQDVVNELGRRLEYEVENGRYQGTKNAIGFDGLWRDPGGHSVIVEVKTTDTYRLSLDTVVGYRDRLREKGKIKGSSILIVVGRTDTGELEAQVRGSRHAWDIRLISIDSLFSLVRVKENADSSTTVVKIRKLLTPVEYTRLDELVDVVFTAAQDIESAASAEGAEIDPDFADDPNKAKGVWQFTPEEIVQAKRDAIVKAVSNQLSSSLIKKSRASYWNSSHEKRLVCTVSKRYLGQGSYKYWYAYHSNWDEFLSGGMEGYFALGCVDLDMFFMLPLSVIREHIDDFNTTKNKNKLGHYCHIHILEPLPGSYELNLPKADANLPLNSYILNLD